MLPYLGGDRPRGCRQNVIADKCRFRSSTGPSFDIDPAPAYGPPRQAGGCRELVCSTEAPQGWAADPQEGADLGDP